MKKQSLANPWYIYDNIKQIFIYVKTLTLIFITKILKKILKTYKTTRKKKQFINKCKPMKQNFDYERLQKC